MEVPRESQYQPANGRKQARWSTRRPHARPLTRRVKPPGPPRHGIPEGITNRFSGLPEGIRTWLAAEPGQRSARTPLKTKWNDSHRPRTARPRPGRNPCSRQARRSSRRPTGKAARRAAGQSPTRPRTRTPAGRGRATEPSRMFRPGKPRTRTTDGRRPAGTRRERVPPTARPASRVTNGGTVPDRTRPVAGPCATQPRRNPPLHGDRARHCDERFPSARGPQSDLPDANPPDFPAELGPPHRPPAQEPLRTRLSWFQPDGRESASTHRQGTAETLGRRFGRNGQLRIFPQQ